MLDLVAPEGQPLRVLHLGGGAGTPAGCVAATRPGSTQLVVEADDRLADTSSDLVLGDVFEDARTPGLVTTRGVRPVATPPARSDPRSNLSAS